MTTAIRLTRQALRCPYCHAGVGAREEAVACCGCAAVVHRACWGEHGSCPSCGVTLAQAHRVESLRSARPAPSLRIRVTPSRCQALTRSGSQCSRRARCDGYCWQHQDAGLVEVPLVLNGLELHEVAPWPQLEEVGPTPVRARPRRLAPQSQRPATSPPQPSSSSDHGGTRIGWLCAAVVFCVVLALFG